MLVDRLIRRPQRRQTGGERFAQLRAHQQRPPLRALTVPNAARIINTELRTRTQVHSSARVLLEQRIYTNTLHTSKALEQGSRYHPCISSTAMAGRNIGHPMYKTQKTNETTPSPTLFSGTPPSTVASSTLSGHRGHHANVESNAAPCARVSMVSP